MDDNTIQLRSDRTISIKIASGVWVGFWIFNAWWGLVLIEIAKHLG